MNNCCQSTQRIDPSPKSAVRRKRPRPSFTPASSRRSRPSSCALLVSLLSIASASAYTVTWNFGPEDHFFCGHAWDDYNCSTRQNCRSGKSEECIGFSRGETCFKDTPCDSASGGGHDFSEDLYDTDIPTFNPTIYQPQPTEQPQTTGPTLIPTDVPIGPPPDFDWPSDDPSDHWFCGVGIDDANEKCGIHCPKASECPMGQICYFGTKCDARTHAPSPPPTNRPTNKPTPGPTSSPTITASPTYRPTISLPPTANPTNPQPTKSPTPSPTQSPTHGPLTAIQQGFFCATDWNDAITNCKMRCPSGEDPECPMGEYCFAYTGCTEERGYPNGQPPMRSEAEIIVEDDDDADPEECIEFKVIITADDWPAETSWGVTLDGEVIAEGSNDLLVSGEAVEYIKCLPKKCMEFTLYDTGGDGLCCDHGEGSYELFYDGKSVKKGGVFYDSDVWVFGRCGETPAPVVGSTEEPSPAPAHSPSGSAVGTPNTDASTGGDGGSIYRCIQQSLVDRGYVVDGDLCPRFADCYNKFIDMGDDWFCEDGEVCSTAPACGSEPDKDEQETVVEDFEDKAVEVQEKGEEEEIQVEPTNTDSPVSKPVGRPPTVSAFDPAKPTPIGRPMRPNPSTSTVTVPDPTPSPISSTLSPDLPSPAPVTSTPEPSSLVTSEPTAAATSVEPSLTPTTSRPTLGPCDGEPCSQRKYCRSEHGFCGPDGGYCNEKSIWTKDCPKNTTPSPSFKAATPSPTEEPVTPSPALAQIFVNDDKPDVKPSFQKPSGGGKPGGGKGPIKEVKPTSEPTSEAPTEYTTETPTESDGTPSPTATFLMFGSQEENDAQTPSPVTPTGLSVGTVNFVSLPSDADVPIEIITDEPTPSPEISEDMRENSAAEVETNSKQSPAQTNSAVLDSSTNVDANELECVGEPCELDSWCRSSYGSCGPGFIYCNAKAIWTSSCRLTHPETPSKGFSSDSVARPEVSVVEDNIVESSPVNNPAPSPNLGLPKLPKPTLPTISEYQAAASTSQQEFAAQFATADLTGNNDSRGVDDEDNDDYEEVTEPKEKDPSEKYAYYDSPEYEKQWQDWAQRVQSGTPRRYSFTMFAAILSMANMLICS